MRFSSVLLWVFPFVFSALVVSGSEADENVERELDVAAIAEAIEALDGVVLRRPEGNYIQVVLEQNRIVLRFFDQYVEPMQVDVDSGILRLFRMSRSPEQLSIVPREDGTRNPSESGTIMTHSRTIRSSFTFSLRINLFREGESDAVEQYITQFSGRQ